LAGDSVFARAAGTPAALFSTLRIPRRFYRAVLLAGLAGSVAGAVGESQAAQKLRYRFAPGQVDQYAVDVRLKIDSSDQNPELSGRSFWAKGTNTVRVVNVNPDRSARIQVSVAPLRVVGTSPDPGAVPQVVNLTMSPTGEGPGAKLVRGKPAGARDLFVDPSALARVTAILPAQPVKPGDRWSYTAANPFSGSGAITIENRYFGPVPVEGKPSARIHQFTRIPLNFEMQQPGGKEFVSAKGALKVFTALHFSPSLGKPLRSSAQGIGTVRLTPRSDRTGKDSVVLTLNVEAVSELIRNAVMSDQ
jgi:hypothetical protein